MFDKLEDLLHHYEELMNTLSEPVVENDRNRFRKRMKEQSDLQPIVDAYKEYKACKQTIEDSLAILDEESDEEMRELAKEELNEAKSRLGELEQKLKILLLPKDPNDDKNVIVEIRAGAGGEEAALFAAEIYRMYVHYAERRGWKVETLEADETGIGGMKSVNFMVTGAGAYSVLKYESRRSPSGSAMKTVCWRWDPASPNTSRAGCPEPGFGSRAIPPASCSTPFRSLQPSNPTPRRKRSSPKNSAAATGSGSTTVFTELFRTVRRKWLSRK